MRLKNFLTAIRNREYRFTDAFNRPDGSIGGNWSGSTWTIASGQAVNTPTRTTITVTNGSMEADANWLDLATPVSQTRSNEQAHGGTYSRKAVSDALNDGFYQSIYGFTAKRWYECSGWLYVSAGSAVFTAANLAGGSGNNLGKTTAAASWVQGLSTGRATGTGVSFNFKAKTAVSTFYGDDAACDEFTLSTLFASIGSGRSDITVRVKMTGLGFGKIGGLVMCLDSASNPQNFLIAYHSGDYVLLEKCVAGTYTTLITGGVVYADGKEIKLVKKGNTVKVFYDDAQVGTTQTLTDNAIINGTRHGLFSTNASCLFDSFEMTGEDHPIATPVSTWPSQSLPQYLTNTAAVLIRIDDFQDDAYYVAHAYMMTKRARGTFYVATGSVDTTLGTFVTWWMLRQMERYGWSIAGHTRAHSHLDAMSQADATTAIQDGMNDLISYGFKAAKHFSYPYGEHDAETYAAAAASGLLTAMTIDGGYPVLSNATDLFDLDNRETVDSLVTLATMEGVVDYAKANNKVAGFLFHTCPGDISVANLQALIDYVIAQGLPFVTIEDIYACLSGSIHVPIPIA